MEKINRKYLVLVLALCGVIAFASIASAGVTMVRCITWQGDPAKYHTAISGQAAQLKAVINTDDTSTIYYQWIYGDGTSSSATPLTGGVKYNVTVDHVYTGAVGTPFTAILKVANDATLTSGVIQDTYHIKIEDVASLDVKVNIAIDKGLWWLYRQGNNHSWYSYVHTYDNSPHMTWYQTQHISTMAAPTASAVHAFGINGHKIHNDPNQDPYVEAVRYGMNYLMKGYYNTTDRPALIAHSIGPITTNRPAGLPDDPEEGQADPNGYGIEVYDLPSTNRTPYQVGQVMDAIISSGVLPGDLTGRDFAPSTPESHIWTYGEVLQDMVDMHAWGQWDGTGCHGGICGSWWYNWNYSSPGDNSASQWPAIGMIPAQEAPWNATVPQWVRDYNKNWLAYSMGCTGPTPLDPDNLTSCSYSFFSYNGVGGCAADDCLATTPSGMVQMIFDGQTQSDIKWDRGEKYIADRWRSFIQLGSNYGSAKAYGWYSFAKAMRLSLPTATTQLVKSSGESFDWYYGDPTTTACTNEANCEKGLAQRILEFQSADGYWNHQSSLINSPLATAWMIIILKPALFAAAPIACFDYNPKSTYSGDTVTFDPSCSGHSEAGKDIDNLTLFEWDWDNDGTYDVDSATPSVQMQGFTCALPPCTFPVTLRVSDDANPALTATVQQDVTITNPPHPPVADADGPYMVSMCASDSLTLDGSASFDPNEGEHEAGCSSCPDDMITSWDWDLVPPLTDFTDQSGEIVTIPGGTGVGQVGDFFSAGSHSIGLQVTDNTALSFPGSPDPNLTDADFSTVQVFAATICNLAARPKDDKVQLTWTHTGAPGYDIYRSTEGPNTGFVKIAGDVATTYATYLDNTVVIGTTYYYRVAESGMTGGSNAVSVTPTLRVRRTR
ncbi:MAG: hypothetical protein JXR49_22215 [Acidobacteria bacterium]|nr:hypothetical protein [Acidobacteriota bacterium]